MNKSKRRGIEIGQKKKRAKNATGYQITKEHSMHKKTELISPFQKE